MTDRATRLKNIVKILESLPEHRLLWVEKVTDILNCPHSFSSRPEGFMTDDWCLAFGDALMIHHAFSNEPFTKDKFEHALVNTAKMVAIDADLAPDRPANSIGGIAKNVFRTFKGIRKNNHS